MANTQLPEGAVKQGTEEPRGHQLVRLYEQAKTLRGNWESHWIEIAERVFPSMVNPLSNTRTSGGDKNTNKMLDAGAAKGLERFASAMESLLTPRGSRWHRLKASDKSLMRSLRVQRYFDEVTDCLFQYRYSTKANYASNQYESYMSMGAFGTGQYRIEPPRERGQRGLRYGPAPLADIFYFEDYQGRITTMIRRFRFSAAKAVAMFGIEKLPKEIVTEYEKAIGTRSERDDFEFIQVVQPNANREPDRADYRGMAFISEYVAVNAKHIVEVGGYRTWPIPINRYVTAPGEVYGRSPAMLALPAIKTLNAEKAILLKQGHRAVDPIVLAHDDGIVDVFDFTPGSIVPGGVNAQGQRLIQEFGNTARVDVGLELMALERRDIDDIFLVTLFQILTDNPQMTATEVIERVREKGALLAPTAGRQQSEAQGPQIEREIDLLAEQGLLPEMPPELIEAAGEYEVEYENPLSRMQKAEEVTGLTRTLAIVLPYVEATGDPSPLMRFNMDRAVPDIAWVNAVPARWQNSDEELAAIKQAVAQQNQMKQMIDAAPGAAQVIKAVQPAKGK